MSIQKRLLRGSYMVDSPHLILVTYSVEVSPQAPFQACGWIGTLLG